MGTRPRLTARTHGHQGAPDEHAVVGLLEVGAAGVAVHAGVQLGHPGQVVEHRGDLGGFLQHLTGQAVPAVDQLELVGGEALLLDAAHIDHVGVHQGGLEVLRLGVGAAPLLHQVQDPLAGLKALGLDKGEVGVVVGHAQGQGVGGAGVLQVAAHHHLQPVQGAPLPADGEHIQQGLGGVLVGAVAGVDHRDPGDGRRPLRRARLKVPQRDHVAVVLDGADGVLQGLPLPDGGGLLGVGHGDAGAAQLVHGRLEGQPGAGGGLVEEGTQHHVPQGAHVRLALDDGLQLFRQVQDVINVGAGQVFDSSNRGVVWTHHSRLPFSSNVPFVAGSRAANRLH